MFDLLKKSRAVKFLCSACLLCYLGSFVNVNAEGPVEVATAYVKGPLGNTNNSISFENNSATINGKGQLSGTLKWKTTNSNNETTYVELENDSESAKLMMFVVEDVKGTETQRAATKEFAIGSSYKISNEQLYSTTSSLGDLPPDTPSNFTNIKPGIYKVYAIVTNQGQTSLISGPIQGTP